MLQDTDTDECLHFRIKMRNWDTGLLFPYISLFIRPNLTNDCETVAQAAGSWGEGQSRPPHNRRVGVSDCIRVEWITVAGRNSIMFWTISAIHSPGDWLSLDSFSHTLLQLALLSTAALKDEAQQHDEDAQEIKNGSIHHTTSFHFTQCSHSQNQHWECEHQWPHWMIWLWRCTRMFRLWWFEKEHFIIWVYSSKVRFNSFTASKSFFFVFVFFYYCKLKKYASQNKTICVSI